MTDDRGRALRDLIQTLPYYEFADKDWNPTTPDDAARLGEGASSQVYPVLYRQQLRRVVKVLHPRKELVDALGEAQFAEGFQREAAHLLGINHQNLVKLVEFGSIAIRNAVTPFIVMDFVDGKPLDEFCQLPETTGYMVLEALDGVLAGLEYLHSRHILHCDLKPRNILVRVTSIGDRAVVNSTILDLGVSKVIPTDLGDSDPALEEFTYFFGTSRYVIPELRSVNATRSRNRATRRQIIDNFPAQDLYSFGVILADLLAKPTVSSKLSADVGGSVVDALVEISDALRRPGDLTTPPVGVSASHLRLTISQLNPRTLAPYGVSELAQFPTDSEYITTTLGRVALTGRMYDLTWHPLFWRLHDLPQLELLYYVYPGARHSRFLHSINTLHVARQMLSGLLSDCRTRLWLSSANIEMCLFRALLHDIGHYPMSHVFEDLAEARHHQPHHQRIPRLPLRDDIFVALTAESVNGHPREGLINGIHEAAAAILDRKGRRLWEYVGPLSSAGSLGIGTRSPVPSTTDVVMASLLSCPFDACKLAYLVDDSIMTGLPFGRAIDVSSIASALMCPDSEHYGNATAAVGIRKRGVPFAAAAVDVRLNLIKRGYWHQANRSMMAMFKYVVARLMAEGELDFQRYFIDNLFKDERQATVWLRDAFDHIGGNETNPLTSLVPREDGVFEGEYSRVLEVSLDSGDRMSGGDRAYRYMSSLSPFDYGEIYDQLMAVLNRRFNLNLRPGDLLFDIPLKDRENLGGKALVYDDIGGAFLGDLFEYVSTIRDFPGEFDRRAKVARVLMHPVKWRAGADHHSAIPEAIKEFIRGDLND